MPINPFVDDPSFRNKSEKQHWMMTEGVSEEKCFFLGRGKDQLPWKSLVTFLYEDHCLSDAAVVKSLWKCYEQNDKYKAVELLAKAYTCRYCFKPHR